MLGSRAGLGLLLMLLLFNVFALTRAMPINTYRWENDHHLRGNYDRRVTRIYNLAKGNADKPFWEVRNHAIFHRRNPGFFMLVAELAIRAGMDTPLPLQLFAVLLFNVGLLFMYGYLKLTFGREGPALFGVAFLLTTPFLLYHSSSIHHEPYAFVFLQAALFSFARYLQARDQGNPGANRYLFWACAGYFMACQNYWMYYVSTYCILLALAWRAGGGVKALSPRLMLLLAAPPVLAAITTVLQAMYAKGGVQEGLFHVADIAVARTGDWRLEGSTWYPDRVFVDERAMEAYPVTVLKRIRGMMGYPLPAFGVAWGAAMVMLARRRAAWAWLVLVGFAALSWNLLMVQHTVIHEFTGMFGHAGFTLIVVTCYDELTRLAGRAKAARLVPAAATAVVLFGLSQDYWPRLQTYTKSIAQHGPGETPEQPWVR